MSHGYTLYTCIKFSRVKNTVFNIFLVCVHIGTYSVLLSIGIPIRIPVHDCYH